MAWGEALAAQVFLFLWCEETHPTPEHKNTRNKQLCINIVGGSLPRAKIFQGKLEPIGPRIVGTYAHWLLMSYLIRRHFCTVSCLEQNVYVSTPTMSPIAGTAAPISGDVDDDGAGGCASDDVGDEMVPMLCLYYDADEPQSDQKTHDYSTANTCFNHCVSISIHHGSLHSSDDNLFNIVHL